MSSSPLKQCPYCKLLFERRVSGGNCPHCGKVISQKGERKKKCPECKQEFSHAASCEGKKFCPHCRVEISYSTRRGKPCVITSKSKNTATELVRYLEAHISHRDDITFRFSQTDLRAQLSHAYKIIDAMDEFISEQDSRLIEPSDLALKVVPMALANGHGNANSLLYLRSGLTSMANEAWHDTLIKSRVNANNNQDFSAYRVQA